MRLDKTAALLSLLAVAACSGAPTASRMLDESPSLDKGGVPHEKGPARIHVKGYISQEFVFEAPDHEYRGGRFSMQIDGADAGSLFSDCLVCTAGDVLQPGGTIGGSFIGEGPASLGKASWNSLFYAGSIDVSVDPVVVTGPGELRTPARLSASISGFMEPPFTTTLPPELEVELFAKGELVMQIVAVPGDPTLLFRTTAEFVFR